MRWGLSGGYLSLLTTVARFEAVPGVEYLSSASVGDLSW